MAGEPSEGLSWSWDLDLGGVCRFHHKIKQLRGWQLAQTTPGVFTWTTPAGRSYTTEPDSHAA